MIKSEAQTRSELIDQQLAHAGWNVKDPMQVVEEFDIWKRGSVLTFKQLT
uniref:Uncharacterized protein n=1 Tax=mine drainage metagenome TaxID=410659 RepID=E6QQC0_9ZZZZ